MLSLYQQLDKHSQIEPVRPTAILNMMSDRSLTGPPSPGGHELTQLLQQAAAGDATAADQLLPLIYENLRMIAQQRMAGERRGHTLQATALVHEAYLRLIGDGSPPWANRAHFFHAAAQAMRRILIEHARARGRQKRGGEYQRRPIERIDLAIDEDPDDILALDAAICRLEEKDERAARIVKLRFFAGLSIEETAEATELSARTVKREWTYARAWLFQTLREQQT